MAAHVARSHRLLSTAMLSLLAGAAACDAQEIVLRGNSPTNRPTFATIASAASIPTPDDFANARRGTGGFLSQITPHPSWIPSIPSDPNAIWQSMVPDGGQETVHSAVIAIPFDVTRRNLGNMQFALRFAVDNQIGSVSCPGIWIGAEGQVPSPLPSTSGIGDFAATTFYGLQFVTLFAPVATGRNYVYLVLNNEGGPGGIIFTGFVQAPLNPGETILNTDTLQATVAGNISGSTLQGVSFTTSVVGGIAEFRLLGDLNLNANEVISVTGSRPARLIIGGNLNMAAGSSIDASAINASASAGGGSGGGSVSGGSGGLGFFGSASAGGSGGSGGSSDCPFRAGTAGTDGGYVLQDQLSFANEGFQGNAGLAGGLGFGSPESTRGRAGDPGWGGERFSIFLGTVSAPGGAGGAGGIAFGSSGGNGVTVTADGPNGIAGRSGYPGATGGGGNAVYGMSLVVAGSGGGSGGGGGGGGSGGCGGRGPAGGGGGGGGASLCEDGGAGGAGGTGGGGGNGGNGGLGGVSGPGGGGGGLLDVIVLGKVTGSGALVASGGDGLPGHAGFPGTGGGPGYSGTFGTAGNGGGAAGGRGGTGGNGGLGGSGATGGPGAIGGGGGGGAGGTVRLFASVLQSFNGRLTARGGASATTPPVLGADGSVHTAFNNLPSLIPSLQGRTFFHPAIDAPRAANPILRGAPTPYIPDLPGGPAPFGMLANVTASQFFPNRPPSAIMGFRRYFGSSPSPALPPMSGFDYCIVGNLSAADLASPTVGIGGSPVGLLRGGVDADPNFGRSFVTLPSLPPGSVWVTLCPQSTGAQAQMGCTFLSPVSASTTNSYSPFFVNAPTNSRVFVDASAPAGGNGTSWATPFADLQSALLLAAAAPAGSGGEISVAAGLYRPDQGPGQTAGNADTQFTLPRGFTVRGGYGGRAASVADTVDPTLYPTILSGDLANNDSASLLFDGGSLVGSPSASISGNHSFTLSTWLQYQPRAARQWVLDFGTRGPVAQDFHVLITPDGTLQNGFYNGWSNTVSIATLANTWIHVSIVYDADAHSLQTFVNGRPVDFDASTITPNLTAAPGTFRVGLQALGESNFFGGMRNLRVWNTARTQAQIVADMCLRNSPSEPGLVASFQMDSVSAGMVPDLAPADGPGNLAVSGAVAVTPGSRADNAHRIAYADLSPATRASLSSLTLRGSSRAAITIASGGTLSVDDLTVTDCIAEQATSIVEINYPSTLIATDWIVSGNTSTDNSIVRAFGAALFDRCVFQDNSAAVGIIRSSVFSSTPGSIFLSNSLLLNNTVATGAVIRRTSTAPTVTASNCTIVNNAGPFVMDGITAYNCVLTGNPPINTGVDIRYSLLQEAYPSGGPGNIVGVPQFVNAAGGDFRLASGSIGVDAGSSSLAAPGASVDLAGSPRILDNPLIADLGEGCPAIDMGAYETAGIIPVAPQFTQQPAPIDSAAPTNVHLNGALTGGNVPVSFRWKKDGVDLNDGPSAGGGVISGATTAALTVTGATAADSGDYVLVARASCLIVTSDAATVILHEPSCIADFNLDGNLDADDLGDFITCYFTAPPCPGAEFNGDGDVNADDLGDFITTYFQGC